MSSFALQSLLALSAAARARSSANQTRSTIRTCLRILPGQPQIFQFSRRDTFHRERQGLSRRVPEARRQRVRRARHRPACRRRLQDPKAARRRKIRALPTRARRLRATAMLISRPPRVGSAEIIVCFVAPAGEAANASPNQRARICQISGAMHALELTVSLKPCWSAHQKGTLGPSSRWPQVTS
jgi:hypothetical protein